MGKHKKSEDSLFSQEDLLEELDDSISFGGFDEIALPSITDNTEGMSARDIFESQSPSDNTEAEIIHDDMTEGETAEEFNAQRPVQDDPENTDSAENDIQFTGDFSVSSDIEGEDNSATKEFSIGETIENKSEAAEAPAPEEVPMPEEAPIPEQQAPEFDTMSGNTGEIDVDLIMKKYLSDEEYNEFMAKQNAEPGDTLAEVVPDHIKDVEEYVSAIETEAEKQAPAEPATETQKVLAELDLASISDDEFDEVDANIMIAFGMKDELSEKIGDEQAQVVEEALKKDAKVFSKQKREKEIPDEIDESMEFTDPSQIGDVFDIYKKLYRSSVLKIIASFLFIFAIFIFENYTFLIGEFPDILSPAKYPTINAMFSLQILLLDCLLVLKPIGKGFKGLFTFRPVPESVLGFSIIASVAYHIGVCFLFDGSVMFFCDLPVALLITMTLFVNLLNLRRDIMSFNIVSSKRKKYVISKVSDEEATLEHEAFDEYVDEDDAVFRVNKAGFVDNFFKRTRTPSESKGLIGAIIPVCLLLSAFFLVYSVLINEDWYVGIRRAFNSFILALPATSLLTYTYPLYRAIKVSFGMGSTIVGESSLEEYSDVGSISFDDKDVFPSSKAKVKSIDVFGNNRIDRVIYNIASLFKVLGGPLGDVLSRATKDFEISDDVEIVNVSDDGIEAVISGKHIFYGKASYLAKNNFTVSYNPSDEKIEMKGEASVAYLVCNDEIAAKIYVHYELDPDFVEIAKRLYNAGLCVGIKTFDPGIDDALISKSINLDEYAIKVMKYRYIHDKVVTQDRVDSGVVSKKGSKSLLRTLVLCDRVNSVIKVDLIVKALSILVAFGLMAYLVFNKIDDIHYLSLYVALIQLFWTIPTLIISKIGIRK